MSLKYEPASEQVEHRQMLVERFNQDPKIFCFISSTRSGGVGINLTGDTQSL